MLRTYNFINVFAILLRDVVVIFIGRNLGRDRLPLLSRLALGSSW